MSRFDPEPGITDFERSLAAIRPSRGAFDRDRLMFEAGRRSAAGRNRSRWAWPALAASLAAVVAGEAVALSRRTEPRAVDRVAYAPLPEVERQAGPAVAARTVRPIRPSVPAPAEAPEPTGAYIALRRQVERYGLEGLPNPQPVLTFSAGLDDADDPSSDAVESFRPHDLEKFMNSGGPS